LRIDALKPPAAESHRTRSWRILRRRRRITRLDVPALGTTPPNHVAVVALDLQVDRTVRASWPLVGVLRVRHRDLLVLGGDRARSRRAPSHFLGFRPHARQPRNHSIAKGRREQGSRSGLSAARRSCGDPLYASRQYVTRGEIHRGRHLHRREATPAALSGRGREPVHDVPSREVSRAAQGRMGFPREGPLACRAFPWVVRPRSGRTRGARGELRSPRLAFGDRATRYRLRRPTWPMEAWGPAVPRHFASSPERATGHAARARAFTATRARSRPSTAARPTRVAERAARSSANGARRPRRRRSLPP
jgi:hypothetical protein